MAEITDSGYPKKDEVIHASDVGETFADMATWVLAVSYTHLTLPTNQ